MLITPEQQIRNLLAMLRWVPQKEQERILILANQIRKEIEGENETAAGQSNI